MYAYFEISTEQYLHFQFASRRPKRVYRIVSLVLAGSNLICTNSCDQARVLAGAHVALRQFHFERTLQTRSGILYVCLSQHNYTKTHARSDPVCVQHTLIIVMIIVILDKFQFVEICKLNISIACQTVCAFDLKRRLTRRKEGGLG